MFLIEMCAFSAACKRRCIAELPNVVLCTCKVAKRLLNLQTCEANMPWVCVNTAAALQAVFSWTACPKQVHRKVSLMLQSVPVVRQAMTTMLVQISVMAHQSIGQSWCHRVPLGPP